MGGDTGSTNSGKRFFSGNLANSFGTQGSPHVRGDGPYLDNFNVTIRSFSPRAWGWSATTLPAFCSAHVLPTCVGMVRIGHQHYTRGGSSPHVRGDGPSCHRFADRRQAFSPRAWGWSVQAVNFSGRKT